MEMGGLSAEQVEKIIEQAEAKAGEVERAAAEQRRQQREQERLVAAEAAEATAAPSPYYADGKPAEVIEQAAPESNGDAQSVAGEPADHPAESSDDAAE
jgi:N utilization substance protein A